MAPEKPYPAALLGRLKELDGEAVGGRLGLPLAPLKSKWNQPSLAAGWVCLSLRESRSAPWGGGAMTVKRSWALIQISEPSDDLSSVLSYYLGSLWKGSWQVLFHWPRRMGNPCHGLLGCWGEQ